MKKKRRKKKVVRRIFAYLILGVIFTLTPLYYVNNVILSDKFNIVEEKTNNFVANAQPEGVSIPDNAKCVAPTFDGNYITYIKSGIFYIKDAKTDKIVKEINEVDPIVYSVPLSDRDIIMYFVYHDNSIDVKTYDMSRQESVSQKTFITKDFYKIADVKYSSYTNMIYVNAEKKTATGFTNTIYRINIMKTITLYATNKKIDAMQLLNNKDTLIYQDSNDHVYIGKSRFYYNGSSKFKLLGIDNQDNVYLMTTGDSPKIEVVNNGVVVDERTIDNPNFSDIYNSNNQIYLIYSNYIYDVINSKKVTIEPNAKIVSITDSNLTYVTQDNLVKNQKL